MNVNVKNVLDQVGKGIFGASNEGSLSTAFRDTPPPPRLHLPHI